MRYVAYLEYLPDVGTFRGSRGAWRVEDAFINGATHACKDFDRPRAIRTTLGLKVLRIVTTRRLRKGTWTNPTALLRRGQIVTPFTNEGVTA